MTSFERHARTSGIANHAIPRVLACVVVLFALLCVLGPRPVAAQTGEPAPLTIESPVDGEAVETPFTVLGVAPPGAQLELWVGAALERVFRADSNGRFSAAVTEDLAGTTEITVHVVGSRGAHTQSVSISVSWGGDAPTRAPELVGKPPIPPRPGESTAAERAPDPVAPKADVAARDANTSEDLPSADELIVAPGEPPPPATASETLGTRAPADDVAVDDQEVLVYRTPPARGVRGLAEAGAGLALGVSGGFVLGLGGLGLGIATDAGFATIGYMVIGGLIGYAVGIPIGVMIAGNAMQGNGKVVAVILGEILGTVAAIAVTIPVANSGGSGAAPLLMFATLPVLGSVLGYELTSDASRFEQQGMTLRPAVTPSRDGRGATAGLRVTF